MPEVTLPELAKITGIPKQTLYNWARAGKITTARTTGGQRRGGWHLFDMSRLDEVRALLRPPTVVSLPELAEITGIPWSTLQKWAKAGRFPTTQTSAGWYRFDLRRLDEIPKPRTRPKPSRLVSLVVLADMTGIPLMTLQRWSRIGKIPTIRVLARLWFDLSRLDEIPRLTKPDAEPGATAGRTGVRGFRAAQ